MKINYDLEYEKNIKNILIRSEFNSLFKLNINELKISNDKVMELHKELISENEEIIMKFQMIINKTPKLLYDLYVNLIQTQISNSTNKEEDAAAYHSFIMPLIIVAMYNNYQSELKVNRIQENVVRSKKN